MDRIYFPRGDIDRRKILQVYLVIFLCGLILADPASGQQKFEPTAASRREAIASGQGREYVVAMEAFGSDAETKERWVEAASAYNEASVAAAQMGQLQKAISHATKGVGLAEKAQAPDLQTNAMLLLADAYGRVGQPQKEREWLRKGVETVKQIKGVNKDFFEGRLYRQLGENYYRQRETKQAIEYLSYSVGVWDARLSYLKSPAGAHTRNAQLAIESAEENVLTSLHRLGNAYLQAGNAQEAVKAFERGMAILTASGLKSSIEASIPMGLGRAYLAQKDFPRALENLTKGLQMAEARRQTSQIQSTSSAIGNILLQTGKPAEAIPYYKKAIDAIESTRSLLESEELRTSFFENKGQIYGGIILGYSRAKNVEEAFNYNERARSRAFLDILGSKVQLGRQAALIAEERALQAKISELKGTLTGRRADNEAEGDIGQGPLRQKLDAAQKAYTDFLGKVREEDKEQASLMNVEPLRLKQLQELLEPGVTVLEYFVLRGRAALWVVEKNTVNFVRLSLDRNELISKVSALRDTIQEVEEKEKFKQASEDLYRGLIEPALRYIKGKELLIIPHDVLHYLPFQALISAQGKYLVQDYPIHYLSSASLMQFTKEKRRASREKALVMGNPDLGDAAYNLRFAEREAREIAQVYPQSAVYVRSEATESKAVSLSPNYDILHFAVHAEFKEDAPLESGLLLAKEGDRDGKLTATEIFSLNLKADLVVLSACETGLGKISSGDEIIGLTRAFIYAGTPSVITTLWKVNDRASYELMREFYSNLKTMKKSEALRQAQLKTMNQFPQPFFWAAYGLTGEP
jgi:CHAT domain-containing protein/Tfp pilus assembly protein PilF